MRAFFIALCRNLEVPAPGSAVFLLPFCCLLVAPLAPLAQADTKPSVLQTRFDTQVESKRNELIDVRRDIHRHPELSGEEKRTAAVITKRLRSLGFEVRTGVGGHGVVGLLKGGKVGKSGPVIAFRADMDAVTSDAPDPVEFKSENKGIRHICGHDVHVAVGLALAEGFAAIRDDLPGSVLLLFQPSEETATGARAMVADGALADPRPDAIFAYHTAPMEVGQLVTAERTMMTWRDRVRVELKGNGDLVAAGKQLEAFVDGIGTINAAQSRAAASGDFWYVQAGNSVPTTAGGRTLRATISTATDAASASAKTRIEEFVAGLEGVQGSVHYEKQWVPGVTNDTALTERAVQIARAVLGEEQIRLSTTVVPTFSEDFGAFQAEVPGVMFFLGVSDQEKGWVGMPHTPGYIADEDAIFVGAKTMAAIILDQMNSSR